jgi:hypothetical protein
MLKFLPDSLRRRLDPKLKVMVEVGYLNDKLQRTETGIHTLLNFIEDKFSAEFVKYLKDKRDEMESDESEA